MRTSTNGDAAGRVAGDAVDVRMPEHVVIPIARTEHEKDTALGFEVDTVDGILPGDPSRWHADRWNTARTLFERNPPTRSLFRDHFRLTGVGKKSPGRSGDRIAWLILTTGDCEFHVRTHRCHWKSGPQLNRQQRHVRFTNDYRQSDFDVGVDRGSTVIAAAQSLPIAHVQEVTDYPLSGVQIHTSVTFPPASRRTQ